MEKNITTEIIPYIDATIFVLINIIYICAYSGASHFPEYIQFSGHFFE